MNTDCLLPDVSDCYDRRRRPAFSDEVATAWNERLGRWEPYLLQPLDPTAADPHWRQRLAADIRRQLDWRR